jgi:hypothetical protein
MLLGIKIKEISRRISRYLNKKSVRSFSTICPQAEDSQRNYIISR